ncbi:MAG: gliding motility-associated-like protein [Bacteroidia bacterium]|jgi:gliding motility-associated-like protein
MKRILSFWLLIVLIGVAVSSHAQTANTTQGCEPLTVQLTAPAGGASWFWVFDDGATANLENPENTYTDPGDYIVEYSATPGGTIIGTITINVYAQPVPEFTADPTEGCAPFNVSFDDITTVGAGVTINGYTWVFGNGGIASGSSPNHTFSQVGSHYVSLEIQTNLPSCNTTMVYDDAIIVHASPITTFTTTPFPATSCDPPLEVSFTNNSTSNNPMTFAWDFGNGNTSTLEDPPSETYTTNGSFPVTLTSTDDQGCSSSYTQYVSIGSPTTDFLIPDTICITDSVLMDNLSTTGFSQWQFAFGNTPVTSTQFEPWVHFNQPGLQDVTLTTSSGACNSTMTVQILVEDPSAAFVSDPSVFCDAPMPVQFTPVNSGYAVYEWMFFHDSTESNAVNPLYVVENWDTTDYSWYHMDSLLTRLVIESSAGCRDTVWHVDTMWIPQAVFFPDVSEGCAPLTVTFSDSSTSLSDIISWEWHLGDGSVVNALDNSPQTATYNSPGHYDTYLIIENAQGCIDTSWYETTIVGDALSPSFTVDVTQVCPGDPVQFTNTTPAAQNDSIDVWHYYSETNRQYHCFDEENPTWSYTNETGLMDVVMMVGFNGCYSTTTMADLIQVDGPIAEIFFNCECDQPFVVEFENRSHDYETIEWNFGDGNTSSDENPVHTYAVTGDYTVTLTAVNNSTGCPISVDEATVYIRDIQAAFQGDSVICQGVGSPFNASLSQDVHAVCWGGYTWQFDDPTMRPITTTDPFHDIPFPSNGQFEVTLIVKDINDCKDATTSNVGIYSIETNLGLSDNHICSPQEVTLSDSTVSDTTVTVWNWTFGDGEVSFDQHPVHTYENLPDTLFIELITFNEVGCTDTVESFITTYQPNSFVSSSPFNPNLCIGESVNFFATDYIVGGSNLEFTWDFLDGDSSFVQNPTHQFDSAGTFIVNMVYTEIASGCIDSTTRTVNVQDFPIAGFMSDGDSLPVFCSPQNVVFNDTSVTSANTTLQWDLGNGNTSTVNPTGTVYTSGTYIVELITTTNYGCADTTERTYTVIGPEGQFVIDRDTICRGEEIVFTITDTNEVYNFTFDFGDGNSSSGVSPIGHTYTFVPPSGETVGKLIVTGLGGECPSEETIPIYIHEVVADFIRNDGIDTALCFQPFPFDNVSLNSNVFHWDFGDGNVGTMQQPGNYDYPGPGTYDVLLGVRNNALGCTDTIAKTIILHPIPEIVATGDTICEGDLGNLDIIDPEPSSAYTWEQPVSVDEPNQPNTTSQPLLTQDYPVSVLDTNSCTNSDSATIFVINPLILTDWDTTIVIGDSICLITAGDAGLYIFDWTPSEGLDCDTCGNPCIQPLERIVYSVEVTDVLGCFTSNADFSVEIYPETFISLPTTFTPNGDEANDIIFVEGWGIKELQEFRVFNRWGEELFFTQDIEEGWNGYYKGVLQNNDVYVYKVTALTWRDETKQLEGYFNLMR